MAGVLVFIAMFFKPDAVECASEHAFARAWLIRLACAAGWTWLSLAIHSKGALVSSHRITPGPDAPAEIPQPRDTDSEEKPRISLRVAFSLALIVFIEELISNRNNPAILHLSPQSIAVWLNAAITAAFWGMLCGAFAAKPPRNHTSPAIGLVENNTPVPPVQLPKRRGFDRVRLLMFLSFFGLCFIFALYANGGDLRLGRSWIEALKYWGMMLFASASIAFFWAPIPAMISCADPEIVSITLMPPKPGDQA
jgi:hypothetical protein